MQKNLSHSFVFFGFLRAIRITILVCRMEKLPRVLGRKKEKKVQVIFTLIWNLIIPELASSSTRLVLTCKSWPVTHSMIHTCTSSQYKSLVTPPVLLTFLRLPSICQRISHFHLLCHAISLPPRSVLNTSIWH